MSSAGNLQEIVPYHVVGNVQEICKFPEHFHLPDMCWKCHLSCKFPAHILLQEMPHFSCVSYKQVTLCNVQLQVSHSVETSATNKSLCSTNKSPCS